MIHKERFLLLKSQSYQIVVTNSGTEFKKNRGQAMIDLKEVEYIMEGDTAEEAIIAMKSSARFLVKQNFYQIKELYERYIDKSSV